MNPDVSRAIDILEMPNRDDATGLTYDAVKGIALALPDVVESTSYGTPALKVRGQLMMRLKEDNETVVVRTTWEERERLLVLHPEVFYLTDHYRAYPWVLMRLATATTDIVARAMADARQCMTPVAKKSKKRSG